MEKQQGEGGGKPQQDTEYASQSASGAKPGFVLSAWSLILGGVFLLLILGGLLAI